MSARQRFATIVRPTGTLLLAAVTWFGVAAWLHHASSLLPARYTWFQPLMTLHDVVARQWFVSAAVAAFLVGRLRQRGAWRLDTLAAWRNRPADLSVLKNARAARIALIALALLVGDALAFPDHNACDEVALLAVAVVAGWSNVRPRLSRVVGEAVFASLAFLVICYAFTIFKALLFVGRTPGDAQLVAIEHAVLGFVPHREVAAWSAARPWVIYACDWTYFRLFDHMALTTTLLLGMRRPRERVEFLGALAVCYLLGGPLYHLWPAFGPAYFEPERYAHLATMPRLDCNPIRGWIMLNTQAVLSHRSLVIQTWAYVACMPSLHCAHELVMLWYARHSRAAFVLSLAFTAMTMLSVVVLGWHYPIDIVAGAGLATVSILVARRQHDLLLPASVMPAPDEPLAPRPRLATLVGALRGRQPPLDR